MHKQLAMLQYADAAERRRATVEQSLGLERRVPMVGKAAETDARDARAAAGYWRTDYAAIAPQHDANGVDHRNRPGDPAAVAERRVPRQPGGEPTGSTPSAGSTTSSRATPRC